MATAEGNGTTLTISTSWDPSTGGGIGIDELYNGVSPYGTNIYEPLVFVDNEMKLRPALANSWDRIDDKIWRFHLRDDVLFHDGTAFDAMAVKSWFDYLLNHSPYSEDTRARLLLEKVTIVDNYTVDMATSEPLGCLPGRLSNPGFVITSPRMREYGKPDGTGPFKFISMVPQQILHLQRNDNYWGEKAKLETLTIKTIFDPSTRIMALQAGDIDLIYGVPLSQVSTLKSNSEYQVLEKLLPMTTGIYINSKRWPLNDVRVRKALNYAVDRDMIVDQIYLGIGDPAKGIISPAIPWNADIQLNGYPHNLSCAKGLLAEAGWYDSDGDGYLEKDGKVLELELTYVPSGGMGFSPQYGPLAEVIQDELKDAGVKLKLNPIEYGMYWDKLMSEKFDLLLDYWSAWDGDATHLLADRFCSKGYYGAGVNLTIGERTRLDRLIEDAMANEDRELSDKNYRAVQKIVIDDLALDIPLVYEYSVVAANKKVKGFEIHPLTAWGVTMNRVYIEGE
ncbi:MAG TPA: ABC transporter substrate-binding protein [Methanotrichaceae archaeon]|nr:ABC transporter substrate-binding protein [Methanotrichaceae archaeon]HQF15744.1 ABC transporter substrate-binding protein [Methanotrichaceae archaeon]HQI90583.1 ABC transporter substrate-binding protein [Methanotrichaceae archaeon]